jgi:hypothetical protein
MSRALSCRLREEELGMCKNSLLEGPVGGCATFRHFPQDPYLVMDTTYEPISTPNATPEVLSPESIFPPQTLALASLVFAAVLVAGMSMHRPDDCFSLTRRSTVFAFARKRSSTKGSSIVLVGPSDSGKTAILSSVSEAPSNCNPANLRSPCSSCTAQPYNHTRLHKPTYPNLHSQMGNHRE